jgi:hypothetical protein
MDVEKSTAPGVPGPGHDPNGYPETCDSDAPRAKWENYKLRMIRGAYFSATALPGQAFEVSLSTHGKPAIPRNELTKCGCIDNQKLIDQQVEEKMCQASASGLQYSIKDCLAANKIDCLIYPNPTKENPNAVEYVDCVALANLPKEEFKWLSDPAGTPTEFTITQHLGKARFSWTDSSMCETAFSLSRDNKEFVSTYAHDSEQMCGHQVLPEDISDDLALAVGGDVGPRPPGTQHEYCVAAVATVSAAAAAGVYSSSPKCEQFTVKFEAMIQGVVLTKEARLPVRGATISYHVHAADIRGVARTGFTTTLKDGSFKLHILFKQATSDQRLDEDVTISFTKESNGVHHIFDCRGLNCGPGNDEFGDPLSPAEQILSVRHMDLARTIEILEISSVPFTGKVSFPKVAPYTLSPRDTEPAVGSWPFPDTGGRCYLRGAKVCLHAYPLGDEIVCSETAKDGSYTLPAPVGLRLFAKVTMHRESDEHFVRSAQSRTTDAARHQFVIQVATKVDAAQTEATDEAVKMEASLATEDAGAAQARVFAAHLSEEAFDIDPDHPTIWTGMDFEDHTIRVMRVGAHGTVCKRSLGTSATLMFEAKGVTGCDPVQYSLDTRRSTNAEVVVPAHPYDVTFASVTPSYSAVTEADQHGWFFRMGTCTRSIDLTEPPAEASQKSTRSPPPPGAVAARSAPEHTVIFEYRPKPTISISITSDSEGDSLMNPSCLGFRLKDIEESAELTSPAPHAPLWSLPAGSDQNVSISVTEILKNDLGGCTEVEGDVHLRSRIGLSAEEASDFDLDAKFNYIEHKNLKHVLDRSIEVTDDHHIERMCNCMSDRPVPKRDTRYCSLPLQLTPYRKVRNSLDDYRCVNKNHPEYAPVGNNQGSPADLQAACEADWRPYVGAQFSKYRNWLLFAWDHDQSDITGLPSLSTQERAAWGTVGVTKDVWAANWINWQGFAGTVLKVVPTWVDLNVSKSTAVRDTLYFSEETWGRMWALRQRLAGGAVALRWAELTANEQGSLRTLGWSEETYDGEADGSPSSHSWAGLGGDAQRSAAQVLGFSELPGPSVAAA